MARVSALAIFFLFGKSRADAQWRATKPYSIYVASSSSDPHSHLGRPTEQVRTKENTGIAPPRKKKIRFNERFFPPRLTGRWSRKAQPRKIFSLDRRGGFFRPSRSSAS